MRKNVLTSVCGIIVVKHFRHEDGDRELFPIENFTLPFYLLSFYLGRDRANTTFSLAVHWHQNNSHRLVETITIY